MPGWMQHKGIDTYHQEEEQNCGMACLCMVICYVKGDKLTTTIIASESSSVGGKSRYVKALGDDMRFKSVLPKTTLGEREGVGTGSLNLVAVLDRYDIDAAKESTGSHSYFFKAKIKSVLKAASLAHPVIIGLHKPPHFVVCIGHKSHLGASTAYTIVDPADGHVHTGAHVEENKLIVNSYHTKVEDLIVVTGVKVSGGRVKVMI